MTEHLGEYGRALAEKYGSNIRELPINKSDSRGEYKNLIPKAKKEEPKKESSHKEIEKSFKLKEWKKPIFKKPKLKLEDIRQSVGVPKFLMPGKAREQIKRSSWYSG